MTLCQYRDIFGKPGDGFHSYRLFNIAILDLLATLLIGLPILNGYYGISILWSIVILMVVGYIFHKLFCVKTTFTTYIDKFIFQKE